MSAYPLSKHTLGFPYPPATCEFCCQMNHVFGVALLPQCVRFCLDYDSSHTGSFGSVFSILPRFASRNSRSDACVFLYLLPARGFSRHPTILACMPPTFTSGGGSTARLSCLSLESRSSRYRQRTSANYRRNNFCRPKGDTKGRAQFPAFVMISIMPRFVHFVCCFSELWRWGDGVYLLIRGVLIVELTRCHQLPLPPLCVCVHSRACVVVLRRRRVRL